MTTPRTNPFRTSQIEALAFRPVDWQLTIELLTRHQFCGVVIGPHGSGKTAFLLELHARLEDLLSCKIPFVRLNEVRYPRMQFLRLLSSCRSSRVIFVDDLPDQLGSVLWRLARWVRGNQGIIASSHRAGRIPLPTIKICEPSLGLFLSLVSEVHPEISSAELSVAEAAYHKRSGNLREAFLDLYDHFRD